jgi:hypothetical protein
VSFTTPFSASGSPPSMALLRSLIASLRASASETTGGLPGPSQLTPQSWGLMVMHCTCCHAPLLAAHRKGPCPSKTLPGVATVSTNRAECAFSGHLIAMRVILSPEASPQKRGFRRPMSECPAQVKGLNFFNPSTSWRSPEYPGAIHGGPRGYSAPHSP